MTSMTSTTSDTQSSRPGAIALLLGFAAGILTMATHPTGHDVVSQATAGGDNAFTTGIHLFALAGQVLLVFGTLTMTRQLRARRDLATIAFIAFCLASVAILIAATASGLLGPMSVRGIGAADEVRRAVMMDALAYTGLLNQAFAKLHVLFSCLAIALWSVAMLLGREFPRGLGILGIILAAPLAIAVAVGALTLDIHGFLLVVLTQGAWFTTAAVHLWRDRPA
jgi:hypothetical protein